DPLHLVFVLEVDRAVAAVRALEEPRDVYLVLLAVVRLVLAVWILDLDPVIADSGLEIRHLNRDPHIRARMRVTLLKTHDVARDLETMDVVSRTVRIGVAVVRRVDARRSEADELLAVHVMRDAGWLVDLIRAPCGLAVVGLPAPGGEVRDSIDILNERVRADH